MNGHQQLIAMRAQGIAPRVVWLTDADLPFDRQAAGDWHEQRAIDGTYHAHIRVTADEIPETLDLRCLHGLEVHINSERGNARFQRLFDAVKAAGASIVVGVCDREVIHHKATGTT